MKFILGLIFGMAITFAGAWFLAFAQSAEPADKAGPQKIPTSVPPQVAATASPRREQTPAEPGDEPPPAPAATTAFPAQTRQTADIDKPEIPETPEQGSKQVWTLFHSEASASGFANYLSHSVDHPFVVTRLGPAQYQVSYNYTSSEQAQALAAKVDMITGAK